MAPSAFERILAAAVQVNPWTWIALIFGGQSVGALFVAQHFRMNFFEVAIPVLLLFFGTILAGIFRLYDHALEAGSWKWRFPAAVYALFIFFLSNRSYADAQVSFDTKLFHPVEYMTLGIFLSLVWRDTLKEKGVSPFLLRVLLAGLVYGMVDELHQAFIPGRSGNFLDVFIDFLGVNVGCGLFLVCGHVKRVVKKRSCALCSERLH